MSRASIGPLNAILGVDTTQWSKGLQKAEKDLGTAMKRFGAMRGTALEGALRSQARQVADLRAQVEASQLRRQGRGDDAELVAVARKYDKQIEQARVSNRVELSLALQKAKEEEILSTRLTQKRLRDERAIATERKFLAEQNAARAAAAEQKRLADERAVAQRRARLGLDSFSLESVARIGLSVSAAVNAANIGTKLLKGDMEAAAEAVKSLPFGVGQMARALEGALGDWTGITREIENANKLTEAQNRFTDSAVRQAKAYAAVLREMRTNTRNINEQADLIGARPPAGELSSARQQAESEIEASRRRAREAVAENNRLAAQKLEAARGIPADEATIRKTALEMYPGIPFDELGTIRERKIREQAQANPAAANTIEADRTKKNTDILKAAAEEEAAIRRRGALQTDEINRRFREEQTRAVDAVRVEVEAKRLGMSFREQEAAALRINAEYAEKIRQANEQGNDALARQLGYLRDMTLQEERQRENRERSAAARGLGTEIAQAKLELAGRKGDAQALGIASSFDERIRDARERGDFGTMDSLKQLRDLRLQQAEEEGAGSLIQASRSSSVIGNRVVGIGGAPAGGIASQLLSVKGTDRQIELLEKLLAAVRDGVPMRAT